VISKDQIDWNKVEEVALALLCLNLHDGRVWKGLDWDLMNRLHERGWILDPKSKAKSIMVTEEGEDKATEFFRKHFAKDI
jgi:hypothetical protein